MGQSYYIRRFTVRGAGEFPFDMLRYDMCWPASPDDVAQMMSTGRRTVTLHTPVTTSPTTGRWDSFLWQVTEVD